MFTDTRTVERITVQDSVVAEAWSISAWGWSVLTDSERTDFRNRVVYAPNFSTEGK